MIKNVLRDKEIRWVIWLQIPDPVVDIDSSCRNALAIASGCSSGTSIISCKEYEGSPALDAGLLAAAQAVEHYEMSRYGTLRTWALELGLHDAAGLLQTTLDEEQATDLALTFHRDISCQSESRRLNDQFLGSTVSAVAPFMELIDRPC
jgi:ferritin-like metal-binding protein YciE